jgi:Htaa
VSRADSGSLGGLATAAVIAAAVAVAPAHAVAASGRTTLVLNGPVAESLRDDGVRIAPVKPASGGARRITLPVAAGLAGSATTLLSHRGGIELRRRRGESLRMTKLRLVLGKRSRLRAEVGGTTMDVFRILRGGQKKVDPANGTVALSNLRLKLTAPAAQAIARLQGGPARMGRKAIAEATNRPIGSVSVSASGLLAGGEGATGAAPGGGAAAGSSGCPLPSGAGPAPEEPLPAAARPAGAVGITSATIDWHVRESFIRYIGTGEGTSVSGGASADPPVQLPGTSAALSYGFHFPFAGGWHDAGANPADPTDDTAAIEFGGAVRFLYSDHEIDLTTAAPEIEIAGAKSRVIFALSESGGAAERQVLVNLDLSHAAAIEVNGGTYTYTRVPGAIPSGTASSVFAGFYAPGTEFGCFTVSYSTG